LGAVYLLYAQREAHKSGFPLTEEYFWNINKLLLHASSVVVSPDSCRRLIVLGKHFAGLAQSSGRAVLALTSLEAALPALSPGAGHILTGLHAQFVQLCLVTKHYRACEAVLSKPVFEVLATGIAREDSRDVMLYYYYGGMVFIGLKRLSDALEFFRMCFVVPGSALSAIVVETFKKFLLVSLIETGSVGALPSCASSPIVRGLPHYTAKYVEFGNLYSTLDSDKMLAFATENAELFQKDNNFGLVKQVIKSVVHARIKRLTKVYITLSLEEVAKQAGLPSAQDAVREIIVMIEKRKFDASINMAEGVVEFRENVHKYDNPESVRALEASIQTVVGLSGRMRALSHSILTSPLYLRKAIAASASAAGAAGGTEAGDGAAAGEFESMM